MRVIILHSAIAAHAGPDEQDTLVQVDFIKNTLEQLGCKVTLLPFTLNLMQLADALHRQQPALVFNLVESVEGRNEFIHLPPLLLKHWHMRYTGSDSNAIFISSDKCLTKRLLQAANIPTAPWLEPEKFTRFPADGPYLVKSVLEDGSLGLDQDSLVRNQKELLKIVADRQQRFGGKWFAERYIAGREFNISLLAGPRGPEVLPIAEIKFNDLPKEKLPIIDYAAKWHPDSIEYQATPRCFDFNAGDQKLLKKLSELSLKCWQILNLSNYARVDVRVDQDGQPWVLEININPCLAPDAGFMAASEKAGLNSTDTLKRIIADALRGE